MLLSDDLGLLFQHVPKTAGMSLRLALRAVAADALTDFPRKHCNASDLREIVGHDRWDKFYTFAFVRNPWAWYVSFYHFILQNPQWLRWDAYWSGLSDKEFEYQRRLHQDLGFNFWLEKFHWSYYTPIEGQSITRVSQWDWINIDGGVTHNDIFKMEEMDGAVEKIGSVINRDIMVPKMNASKHDDYRKYYTEESVKFVADMNKDLIERFGYKFDE